MQLDSSVLDHVEGKVFSNSFLAQIDRQASIPERMKYVEEIVSGSKVLHIGCTDHLPNIDSQIVNDTWLHKRLSTSASECLGIDINLQALEHLHSKHNITNICYGNIESPEKIEQISAKHWDYAIFPEVIEHVDNPVNFLRTFISNYGSNVDKIIITVPNCFQLRNFKYMFSNIEAINSDHRYWFSPYTILKVASRAGLKVEKLQMCKNYETSKVFGGEIKDFFLTKFPIIAQNVVLITSLSNSSAALEIETETSVT